MIILKDLRKKAAEERNRNLGPRTCETLDIIENSTSRAIPHRKRNIKIDGLTFDTVTQLDNYCREKGIDPNRLDIKPQVIPQQGGMAEIDVHLEPKK